MIEIKDKDIFISELFTEDKEKTILQDQEVLKLLFLICDKSKGYIETLSKIINRAKKKRFPDRPEKILGDLSKKFDNKELDMLLEYEKRDKIRVAYLFMFTMGLRVSEAATIQTQDIINGRLTIKNHKCKRKDIRIIPTRTLNVVNDYIEKYSKEIKKHDNYLVYSDEPLARRPNINSNSLRKIFRDSTLELGINEVYAKSTEPKFVMRNGKKIKRSPRPLYLLSSHSGRHTFCMNFYEKSGFDPDKTKIAMRLRSLSQLKHYLKADPMEVERIMLSM